MTQDAAMTPTEPLSVMAFARREELAVLDSALSFLVRDKIMSNEERVKLLQAFGEVTMSKAARTDSSSEPER